MNMVQTKFLIHALRSSMNLGEYTGDFIVASPATLRHTHSAQRMNAFSTKDLRWGEADVRAQDGALCRRGLCSQDIHAQLTS